ncbi:InlB B-repeat-containing protein [Gardnerella greenwoodii]|uniref:G5 domain-containing protein n=1 Tax=Gardnerella greenwoodii TaxID=2914925 RepID=A0A2N6RXJ7_9BIFI|nr:InlB B-repeat-containing protein [Gardnerella greenwoodii]MDF0753596.1 InlB B-repeat-containing protein [Gardnerella greenwoodii]PMC42849.1 hypothetical protein CJ216_01725 [Gardnerella greenwoodii]
MENAGKYSILMPLSIGFCTTVLAVAGGLSANVAYADTTNGASGTSTANLNEVRNSAQNPNDSKADAAKYPTVTFMNGDSTIATVQVKKGASTGDDTPSDLKDTGYTFLGWSTTKGATEQAQVDFTATTPVSANRTVYAVFAKDDNEPAKKHTVTFKVDDAYFKTTSVENGKTIGNSMPSAPSKTGYTFLGWSTTKGATEQNQVDFKSDTAVSANTTVYAVFKRDVVRQKVTFRSSRDNSVIQEIQVERGQKVTSTPSVAAPDGYNFVRWSTSQDGRGSKFDFTKRITKDVTVYAIFKKNPGVVDIVPEPSPTPIPGDSPFLPLPPDPDGPGSDDPLNPGGGSTQEYSVTFKNGDNLISTVSVERGEAVKRKDIPENPQQDGYTFLGWSTKKDASDKSDVNFYAGTPVNSDTTVYAVFEEITPVMYDVTFMNDDAWLNAISVENGKKLDASNLPAPTKDGYNFVGWSTNKNASAADFSTDSEITEDKIVYAVFEAKPYKLSHSVTFKNDGSWIKTVTVDDGETVTEANMPSAPTKSGYKFVGWSTTEGADTADFKFDTAVSSDKTVYAVFTKDNRIVKVEVLVAKMTYKGSSELTFNTTKKTSDPVDGKKVTDGSGTVTLNTPAKDGVTEVGNKQVVEGVPIKQNYDIVSDSKMDFGKSRVVDGEDISSSIVTIYKVDSNRGLTDKIESENIEYSTPSVKSCIYVGNVKKETKDIPFKTTYVSSDSLSYKSENVKIDGKSGKKNITTTYKLSDNPDANYIGDVDSVREVVTNPVVDKVIEVGNVEKKTSDIDFKTTYVADETLPYNTQQDKIAGKKGSKTVTTTYKVDKDKGLTASVESTNEETTTNPTDHVIRVGNKQVTTENIEPGAVYQADSSLAYKETNEIAGTAGTKTTTTTYRVDENTGLTANTDGTPTVVTKAAKDKVIKVGNVKTETKVIKFTTEYIDDDSLAEGTEQVTTQGQKGSEKIVTTYKVDPTNGLTTQVEKTETKDHKDPVNKVVRRGTKKNPPKPPQPNPDPNPNPNPHTPTPHIPPVIPPSTGFTPDPTQVSDGPICANECVESHVTSESNENPQNPQTSQASQNPQTSQNPKKQDENSKASKTEKSYRLSKTGAGISGAAFASVGSLVLGLVGAVAAASRKRAKHLR